jgi:hypothetical protein
MTKGILILGLRYVLALIPTMSLISSVTRLGEFSPFGRLFTLGSFLKIKK